MAEVEKTIALVLEKSEMPSVVHAQNFLFSGLGFITNRT